MKLRIVRAVDELPAEVRLITSEAAAGGHRSQAEVEAKWRSGEERFDRVGEALFFCFAEGALAGLGGVTIDPYAEVQPVMRMRRLYVLQEFRRCGAARALAGAMIQQGFDAAPLLTLRAGGGHASAAFWEAMGFAPVVQISRTHELRR